MLMKKTDHIILGLIFFLVSPLYAATLAKNQLLLSTDISYTSARSLWKGDGDKITFQDNDSNATHNDRSLLDGATSYLNFGLQASYGTPLWGIQADLRLDYTMSKMRHATHPTEANGAENAEVNGLSNIEVKLSKKVLSWQRGSLVGYLGYRNPVDSDPKSPSFLAINDFSTHYNFGAKVSQHLYKKLSSYTDFSYTVRTRADKLKTEKLPANQHTLKLDFLYAHDDKLSLGTGLVWRHTYKGPDISTPAFARALGKAKHPLFTPLGSVFWPILSTSPIFFPPPAG